MRPETLIPLLKIGVGATWVVAALLSIEAIGGAMAPLARLVILLLVVIHAVECVIFLPALRKTERPLAREFAETMAFGAVRFAELRWKVGSA